MAYQLKMPSMQVLADYQLLQFDTYNDYLKTFVDERDKCFIDDEDSINAMISYGFKNSGGLTEDEFNERLQAVKEYFHPSYKPFENASKHLSGCEPFLIALALRERANRVGIISTIIHLRVKLKSGAEVSGYIDYGDRLLKEDWKPIFAGNVMLKPEPTDLGYYNWQSGECHTNSSVFFKASYNKSAQLIYRHKFDRKDVLMDPKLPPGYNSTRTRLNSNIYEECTLIDHVLRQRR